MLKKFLIGTVFSLFLLILLFLAIPNIILYRVSGVLIHEDPLEQVDAIVVLSGSKGNRIRVGAKLFHEGFGKVMVFSGQEFYPDVYEHKLMKRLAISLGVPENKIIARELKGEISTWGEGKLNLRILKENDIKNFILVTSAYHSRRAYAVYEKIISEFGYDMKILMYPAKDPQAPKDWWKTRTGKMLIFMEYIKTLNYYIEH